MKTCTKCRETKEFNQFNYRDKTKGTRVARCKSCTRSISKSHYYQNLETYLVKTKKRREVLVKLYKDIKSRLKCVKCGESHIACLEFHHINDDKLSDVSALVRQGSERKLLEEIAKCDVLCSNCHRKLHYTKV